MCQGYTKKSYTGDDIEALFRRVEGLEEAVQERQVVVDKRLTNLCYRIDGLEQSTKKDVDQVARETQCKIVEALSRGIIASIKGGQPIAQQMLELNNVLNKGRVRGVSLNTNPQEEK